MFCNSSTKDTNVLMPFSIAGVPIDELSGPVSFSLHVATAKGKEEIGTVPILMMLGDEHTNVDKRCDETSDVSKNKVIVSTTTPAWYKLLATMATYEQPIDYFIESFYPPKLLQKEKHLSQTNHFSMPQNHLACFASRASRAPETFKCFTKHIRYHLVDVRYSHEHYRDLKPDDFDVVYEREIRTNLLCCCFNLDSVLLHKSSTYKAIDVLKESLLNPSKFIRFAYDFTNPHLIATSLIYKQTQKQQSKNIDKWQSFVFEYYDYYVKIYILTHPHVLHEFQNVLECINKHQDHVNNVRSAATSDHWLCHTIQDEFYRQYYSVVRNAVSNLLNPLLDIYFLLRSWKVPMNDDDKDDFRNSNRAWLAVLNAGELHCQVIRRFLIHKKWYDTYYIQPTQMKTHTDPLYRCVSLSSQNNLHSMYQLQQLVTFQIPTLSALTMQRIQLFGYREYINLLKGKAYTPQMIETLAREKSTSVDTILSLFQSK